MTEKENIISSLLTGDNFFSLICPICLKVFFPYLVWHCWNHNKISAPPNFSEKILLGFCEVFQSCHRDHRRVFRYQEGGTYLSRLSMDGISWIFKPITYGLNHATECIMIRNQSFRKIVGKFSLCLIIPR